jgi:hypothetical protein
MSAPVVCNTSITPSAAPMSISGSSPCTLTICS